MSIKTIEQIAAVLPYGETVLHKAEEVYELGKDKTMEVYATTRGKVVETRKEYASFKKNVKMLIHNVAEETVNQVLNRVEGLLKIEKDEKMPEDLQHSRQRLQAIVESIYREYILKSRLVTNKTSQALLATGKNYTVQYVVPLYISLKATLLVSKEMMIEFLESFISEAKMTYESSKDHVVMFVGGNFKEENIRKKVLEGIDSFRDFTVRVVNKGLEIRVDRKSLVENYDQFALKFLEIVKEVREKSEENITQIKNKSKDLYKEVVNRIRAKELQLKTNLRASYPLLEAPSALKSQ